MKSRRSIYSVLLGAFVVFAMPIESAAQATSRLRHLSPRDVERSFTPLKLGDHGEVVPITLERLMALNRVPALSVALIDNYQTAFEAANGVTQRGLRDPELGCGLGEILLASHGKERRDVIQILSSH